MSADEDTVITGTFESFGQLQTKLEADGMEIVESGLERVPNTTKELDPEATAEVEKLIERLEEDDDVQNVFHTMSSSTDAEVKPSFSIRSAKAPESVPSRHGKQAD